MLYTDDSQLYITVNPTSRGRTTHDLEECINDIQTFFLTNKVACNPSKTEVIHFSSKFSRLEPISSISIGSTEVTCSDEARNLGVFMDRHLTMSSHINKTCQAAYIALRKIGKIRNYLNRSSTERLVHAFITLQLDYCNSLLYQATFYRAPETTACPEFGSQTYSSG